MSKLFGGMFAKRTLPKAPGVMIKRDCYTMASSDGTDAEITMYGEIVQEQPRDWWTDEPIEGMYIALDQFLEDLKTIADAKRITVRINSVGGDAYAAITIHNRLKELKAEITVIVDGVAMSGGSLIMCAGDTVKVNPSSLIMIHKCWVFLFGGYNSSELRKIADSNDAVDKAQAAIYKNKSGMSEEDVLALMENETYMTGEEAIEKGFADELMEGGKLEIAASADKRTLFVNGRKMRLDLAGITLPDELNIPTVKPAKADEINKKMPVKPGSEGGNEPMANTIEELRAEYPELTKQLEAEAKAAAPAVPDTSVEEAVKAERERQQEIDEIAPAVNDADLVHEAKYGEKPCSAQELAFRAMQKQSKQGEQHTANTAADYQASNATKVRATPTGGEESPVAKVEEAVDAGVKAAKEAFGGK